MALKTMMSLEDALKVVELSDDIQVIVEERDEFTNGDYQGALEGVILKAIQYGRSSK